MTRLVAPQVRIAGRYMLLQKIGSGGQGEVWRAFDERELRSVAVKIVSRTFASEGDPWEALQQEHSVVSELDHPRILKRYAPVYDGELAILPMKLATGGDLRQLRGAPYIEIVPALIEVAHALEHAHERNVVHRDLKPANVLFDEYGQVQLADFGTAGRAHEGIEINQAGTGWSPSSASPQHLMGQPPTPADDLYGLGALAFELLSGSPPYFPDFDVRRVLHERLPPLQPVHAAPRRLIALVRSLLRKDPSHRPDNMGQVITELVRSLDEPPSTEPHDPRTGAH